MKKLLRRPLLLFFIILGIIAILALPVSYIALYNMNRPSMTKIFSEADKKKAVISETVPDFTIKYDVLSYTEATYDTSSTDGTKKVTNGRFKVKVYTSNFTKNVSNVVIEFNIGSEWTKCEGYSSKYKVNSGNGIPMDSTQTFTNTCYVYSKTVFPLHPYLFVTVKNPTLYMKVSYTIPNPVSELGGTSEMTYYIKISPKQYYQSIDDNTTTTTTKAPTTTIPTTTKEN